MLNRFASLSSCAGLPAALLVALAAGAAGVDFESWRQVGSPDWRFDADGVEAGPGDANSFLVSDALYGDFELSVEFWIEDHTNSGVFVRCGEIDGVDAINPYDCLEVNIYDSHPKPDYRTGSVVTRVAPSARVDTLGRWNRLEIRAFGARLEVAVNGIPTASIDDARVGAGPVALQYAGTGLVRFRKLVIEVQPSEDAPAP